MLTLFSMRKQLKVLHSKVFSNEVGGGNQPDGQWDMGPIHLQVMAESDWSWQ